MNVYFDTEFTGLVPDTTLISIGMVDDEGAKFYAEFTDYNRSLCDDWINQNVIANLIFSKRGPLVLKKQYISGNVNCFDEDLKRAGIVNDNPRNMFVRGGRDYISRHLRAWLSEIPERVQLISDVCHYDMSLLCNLFGGAFYLPENVNPVCYDICQELHYLELPQRDIDAWSLADKMFYNFDLSREKYLISNGIDLPKGAKHNALYDAEVIKIIYVGE